MDRDIARILFDAEAIGARVHALAGRITEIYRDRDLTLVAILKGSIVFAADLIRLIPLRLRLGFVAASSYRGTRTTPGPLRIELPDDEPLEGRDVLVVDEILDTGRTLAAVVEAVRARGARDVATCVLVDKRARRAVAIEADHVGFEIDDAFVVGYGLDHDGQYRNLPYIGVLGAESLPARGPDPA